MSIKPGALRFNTDSMKLEIFRGSANYEGTASMAGIGTLAAGQWEEIVSVYGNDFPVGDATGSSTRALFAGGGPNPSPLDTIDYVTIESTGNAVDFGNLTQARNFAGGLSSSTRGVFGGGYAPGNQPTIDFVTISTLGNAADFGDLQEGKRGAGGASNAVRGLFGGGNTPVSPAGDKNIIDYITIATLGNAQDFGDLSTATSGVGAFASSTRGVFAITPVPATGDTIEYVQIMSKGNAVDFGNLTSANNQGAGTSNNIRGLFMGGGSPSINVIQYITITTTGNATDFGDLTQAAGYIMACSDSHGGIG